MSSLMTWLRQPSSLMAVALAVFAVVYFVTGNAALSAMLAGIVPGAVNDHTTLAFSRIAALEDVLKDKGTPNA